MVRPPISRDREAPRREKDNGPRINGAINSRQIRLVDADGEMRGVMTPREAMVIAEEAGLDLVEISPQADPPVCKVLDYGKYKYEMQKKAAEARKKQKVIELKEIKIRPNIDDHDFDIKMKSGKAFIGEGDKVKITLRFRGREMAHQEVAQAVIARVRVELDPIAKVEAEPSFEGRQMVMIWAPR